jgi:hypothetical protein
MCSTVKHSAWQATIRCVMTAAAGCVGTVYAPNALLHVWLFCAGRATQSRARDLLCRQQC